VFFAQGESELFRNQQLLHVALHTFGNRDRVVTALKSAHDPTVRVRICDLHDGPSQ